MTATACTPSLLGDLDIEVRYNEPLGVRTWFRAGGCAEVLASPRTEGALRELVVRCHQQGIPVRVLGEGANLLVADEGVDGVVIRLDKAQFTKVDFEAGHAGNPVRAGGGASLMGMVQEAARLGLDGLAQMSGIPASIGGATRMNAGGKFGDFASAVHSVEVLALDGTVHLTAASDIHFGYRHSELPDGIVVAANLILTPGDPVAIRQKVKEFMAYKKHSQPMADKSAGCMFRNPVDPATGQRVSAGKLIEEAGMKGRTHGSAFVSHVHGNFLSLSAGGSTNDVLQLVREVQLRVREHSGIELEREVVVWSKKGEMR